MSGSAAQAGYNRICLFWAEKLSQARLAQLAERKALNLVVVGSSPTVGVISGMSSFVAVVSVCAAPRAKSLKIV